MGRIMVDHICEGRANGFGGYTCVVCGGYSTVGWLSYHEDMCAMPIFNKEAKASVESAGAHVFTQETVGKVE